MPVAPSNAPADTASTRRRFAHSLIVGVSLTAVVVVLSASGALAPLERKALDLRHRWFDRFTPPPSDRVVHIDIDDGSIQRIGRWPWPRALLADAVDELHAAGAAVIAFDVLFSEPQRRRLEEVRDPLTEQVRVEKLDDDAAFAAAMRRAGSVLLPVDVSLAPRREDEASERCRAALERQPLMSFEELRTRLKLTPIEAGEVRDEFGSLRSAAMRRRVAALFETPQPPTFDAVRRAVLPQLAGAGGDAPEIAMLREQYDRMAAVSVLSRLALPAASAPPTAARGHSATIPVASLASSAAATGFVSFEQEADGVVRTIPLWLADEHAVYPQFALAAASLYLRVPLSRVFVSEDQTLLPGALMPDGTVRDVSIPTVRRRVGDGWTSASNQSLIAWQAATGWMNLFDPNRAQPRQHLPIGVFVEIAALRRTVEANELGAHQALMGLMAVAELPADELTGLRGQLEGLEALMEASRRAGDSSEARAAARGRHAALRREIAEGLEFGVDAATMPRTAAALAKHNAAVAEAEAGGRRLEQHASMVRPVVGGTVCIVGWTGTGSIADFVATSLEPRVPGPMVHGAVLNAILTGHFIRRAPLAADLGLVALVGLIATLVSARFTPIATLVATALIAVTYFAVNGVVLFDYGNVWAEAAGPMLAAGLVWTGVTVFRLVAEQRDRARITRQFKNYVAPELVDYLVQHPEMLKMEGERRELTCMFTDFEGFTTISEQLGPERTVSLLNAYLGDATEALMQHRATVNKYIGDAIVAFWGAPIPNERHAVDACASALAVIAALRRLQDQPHMQGLPRLHMRIGLSTGFMMVGDMGAPPRRSDYTIIGDTVNLGSRIEGVNKQFGTQVLISHRTWELVKDVMLTRPVGRIVVVGRRGYEQLHELLSTHADATQQQRDLAGATAQAIEAYIAGEFAAARGHFEALSQRFGATKLAQRYLQACDQKLAEAAPAEDFDGALVLSEK